MGVTELTPNDYQMAPVYMLFEGTIWELMRFRYYDMPGHGCEWDLQWACGPKPANNIIYKTVREEDGEWPTTLTPLEVLARAAEDM